MKWSHCSGIRDSNVLLSAHVLVDYQLFQVNWEGHIPVSGCVANFLQPIQKLALEEKVYMAESNEHIELKFRIYDGTDIGHSSYASSTTIAALKQKLAAEWPQGKSVVPKTVNDIKLIHLGKVLENNKTLSESGIHDAAFAEGVFTMHVVIQPVLTKKMTAKNQDEMGKLNSCGCTIL